MHLLFVCTGNTCRSPMAAFFARAQIQERQLPWTVESAGLHAAGGMPMTPAAADALTRRRVPLAPHQSQPLTDDLVARADIILVMTRGQLEDLVARFPQAKGKVHLLGSFAGGTAKEAAEALPDSTADRAPSTRGCDIVDPFGGSDEHYEACADQIARSVEGLVNHLLGETRP
ncbi:low molecular weight protein arginine phosphatase [Alicyclobacillus sp.]|uniref:low molecular weight protein arginine phosphatase n=1 Tax=Alicyclobacillus sp. TaxID=61169 RepID=UPI0025B8BF5C|nr:low molecular weight protein arginine phosphatase [Alicyclobacillus sp.]MCL6515839.1 low molecular weight protein arginine phosphatase [Alicyclobacillus sp.]